MTTPEEARELLAQKRQEEKQLEEKMLTRAIAEIEQAAGKPVEEEARELLAQKRQEEEHLKETMLHRSEEEIKPQNSNK
ncbi:MAG: hypothetical protein D6756_13445 [Cyanobacteria bacterium J083]|nr:MAG: hypothetical protein D6756_13445 [Cyanobacteria bacterium J083]